MWRIYLETNNGIAIKSSFEKIKESLTNVEENIYISKIRYIDQSKTTFKDLQNQNRIGTMGSSVNQFTYKRIAFEHEKELRLFFVDTPIPGLTRGEEEEEEERESLNFKKIKINLDTMADEIFIAPFADSWFKDLVQRLLSKYGKDYKLTQSSLYEIK